MSRRPNVVYKPPEQMRRCHLPTSPCRYQDAVLRNLLPGQNIWPIEHRVDRMHRHSYSVTATPSIILGMWYLNVMHRWIGPSRPSQKLGSVVSGTRQQNRERDRNEGNQPMMECAGINAPKCPKRRPDPSAYICKCATLVVSGCDSNSSQGYQCVPSSLHEG